MSVHRLTYKALKQIAAGQVKNDATCVVKFYSNGCHMCHNLKEYYHDLSENDEYEGLHFYAFNIDQHPEVQESFGFSGVPTLAVVNTYRNRKIPKINILADPDDPNEQTFYKIKDIKRFISENRDE